MAYLVAIVVVAALIRCRAPAPQITAARELPRNHQLVPGDLDSTDTRPIDGRYLKARVPAGGKVTLDMTAPKPLPAAIANTMAAVVTIPAADAQAHAIKPGAEVQVCVADKTYWPASKVLDLGCDEHACQVLLQLPAGATQTLDPKALADASLAPAAGACPAHP